MKNRILIILLTLCFLLTPLSAFAEDADTAENGLIAESLRFNDDGRFRILHITDTHLDDENVKDTTRLIALACDLEQPDLVVLTGDLAPDDTLMQTARLTDALMQIFETRKIPVAVTFGNHDSENGAYTREAVMAMYLAYDYSVSIDDGAALTGCGTYLVPVLSSQSEDCKMNLWIFDSGDYDDEGHYANVAEDQVAWYRNASAAAETQYGGKIPSLVFQHIIVPEVYEALEKKPYWTAFSYRHMYDDGFYYRFSKDGTNYGMLHETPCCGYYNHGQFAAMAERGDVLAVFTGHDHTNAFGVRYQGIDIVNSLSTRYEGDAFSTQYGYRVIDLNEAAPKTYETRVVHWYDFAGRKEVRQTANAGDALSLMSKIRFLGFFRKLLTDFCVCFVRAFIGRTVRYPD